MVVMIVVAIIIPTLPGLHLNWMFFFLRPGASIVSLVFSPGTSVGRDGRKKKWFVLLDSLALLLSWL